MKRFLEWGWVGAYLDLAGERLALVYLLFGAVYWSRQPSVFGRLMSLLYIMMSTGDYHMKNINDKQI